MISSLLHLVGLRPRVYHTLTNFREGGGGKPQFANVANIMKILYLYISTDSRVKIVRLLNNIVSIAKKTLVPSENGD